MGYWENHPLTMAGGNPAAWTDTYVCFNCFDSEGLRNFVQANAEARKCDFCGASSRKTIATSITDVATHIDGSIRAEYAEAADGVGWDSREGGWQGASVWDTDALLFDEIGLDLPRDSGGDLRKALLDALPSTDWSQRDPYGYSDEEYLRYSWDSFCELVKFRNRFFFADDPGDGELLDANGTLQKISDLCSEHRLIMDLPIGTRLFRSRPVKGDLKARARKNELKIQELGPPPKECATQSNRMSPAGIVMFYAREHPLTALRETARKSGSFAIGQFETRRAVRILDLTRLPPVPSLFDPSELAEPRAPLIFLRQFTADVSKSVAHDERVHVDYVPTQVVTEYFRSVFKMPDGSRLSGIRLHERTTSGSCVSSPFRGPK